MYSYLKALLLLLFLTPGALAATVNLNSSMSTSAMQAAITAAGNNSTINFAAGTYTITGTPDGGGGYYGLSIPCVGVTVTGPTHTPFTNPTAILNGASMGTSGVIFSVGAGCNGLSISNLWFENTGWIYFNPGNTTTITLTNNLFTGLPDINSGAGTCCDGPTGVFFDGNISRTSGGGNNPVDTNIVLTYNVFGDATSCPNSFATGEINSACTAVFMHPGTLTNFTFEYNHIYHVNEGLKFSQATSGGSPSGTPDNVYSGGCTVDYNYFQAVHRISFENQFDAKNVCNIDHNAVLVDGGAPYFGTLTFSMACCTWSGTYDVAPLGFSPGYTLNDLMMVSSVAPYTGSTGAPFAVEYWGINPQMINSYLEGYFYNMVSWNCANNSAYTYPPGTSTSCLVQNTYMCAPSGFSTTFINNEEGGSPPPTTVNNTYSTTGCQSTVSSAPTISPAGGGFTGSQTVTLATAGVNTSIWYTTDGSTPVPGAGTAQLYAAPFAVTATTTVKAVGMWGVAPQPLTWPAGYGYTPSAPVSATFTSGGGPAVTSPPVFNPAGPLTFGSTLSVSASSATSGATLYCTQDGSTPTTSSPVYTGPFTLTATTLLRCLAGASGLTNSAVVSSQYTYSLYLGQNVKRCRWQHLCECVQRSIRCNRDCDIWLYS